MLEKHICETLEAISILVCTQRMNVSKFDAGDYVWLVDLTTGKAAPGKVWYIRTNTFTVRFNDVSTDSVSFGSLSLRPRGTQRENLRVVVPDAGSDLTKCQQAYVEGTALASLKNDIEKALYNKVNTVIEARVVLHFIEQVTPFLQEVLSNSIPEDDNNES